MGLLVDGRWQDRWYDTDETGGRFERQDSVFRNWITADGSPGPSGEGGFPAEAGRYHLYVSLACPWAHRTLIMRKLEGLKAMIGVSVVHWHMGEQGWSFEKAPGATGDRLFGHRFLHEVYTRARQGFTGRVTVPVLWDETRNTIVSNESAEIIRMFDTAFDGIGAAAGDFYPQPLRDEIDAVNARVYETVNNGVYKAGFATSQKAYDEAVAALFESLDRLEAHMTDREWLVGERMTEADIRLFTTLIRFDPVYHGHFKCNIRRLIDYPALRSFTRRMLGTGGIADTVNMHHIKHHYYGSHPTINPTGIVPAGPAVDLLD
ncbi:MAG: glutathione S-transferase family protein [Geminicoccaceae bacterium]|nr:glutathione S-transferase family protein [Geminicoccaceae bacterium]